jgi:hypothetical protein
VPDARRGGLNDAEHVNVVEVPVEPRVDQLLELLLVDGAGEQRPRLR